ncbi:MAG: LysR substrate-binding domain-containing protein [Ktedonobacteraceae bacterium]
MEIRHLRYFAVVAQERSFRRAAERLAMAQPPLSLQVHDLEEELGVQLFDRTHRQIQLTVAGEVFLEDVLRLLAQLETAKERAKRASKGELGQLTIGYTSFVHCPLFREILQRYTTLYPHVDIVLHDLVTIDQMKQLDNKMLDLSFATHASLAFSSSEESHLKQECILREPVVAVLPKNHPLAERSPLPFAALASEPWIWFGRQFDPTTYDYMLQLFEHVGFRPKVTQHVHQLQIVISLVAAGLGVGLVTASTERGADQDVVYRELVDPTPWAEFNIVWRKDDTSPLLHAFLSVVKEIALTEARKRNHSV